MNIWLAALGFVTAPIMLHHLGRPAYGVFAVVNLVSAQLNNLEFGFGFGMVRFLAGRRPRAIAGSVSGSTTRPWRCSSRAARSAGWR